MKFPGVDPYTFKARLSPGLLVLFPVAVLFMALGIRSNPVLSAALSFLVSAGGAFLLAQVVRRNGLEVERKLVGQWGGMPTTRSLEWQRDSGDTVHNHATISAAASAQLPSQSEEEADPAGARVMYDQAVDVVRARTRDAKKFHLLHEEDMNYGFARNLLAVRMWGVVLAVGVGVLLAVLFVVDADGGPEPLELGIGSVLCAVAAIVWFRVPTPKWVEVSAEKYRDALYDAARLLNAER